MNNDIPLLILHYFYVFKEEIMSNICLIRKGCELGFLDQIFPEELIQIINFLYVKCKIEETGLTKISCGTIMSIICRNGSLYTCGRVASSVKYESFQYLGIKDVDLITYSSINCRALYYSKNKLYGFLCVESKEDTQCDKYTRFYQITSDYISVNIIRPDCYSPELNFEIVQIKSGKQNSFILNKQNLLFGCGDNTFGQLGLGEYGSSYCKEFRVINIPNVISFECGNCHTLVLTKEGLFGCGSNSYGQIGRRNLICHTILTKLDIDNVISFSCGKFHSMILTKEGLFYCGAKNETRLITIDRSTTHYCECKYNFMKLPLSNIISFSCGFSYSLILTTKGLHEFTTEVNFGDSVVFHNLNLLDYMKNVLSISCGENHSIVLTKEGLFSRGNNENGQLGLGDFINRLEFEKIVF